MIKNDSIAKSGNTGNSGYGKSGYGKSGNRFFYSKDQSVIEIFYTSWYNQSIKEATATQGG